MRIYQIKDAFLQSWSSYGVNWTIIGGIVGINPDVAKKTIIIKPTLPKELDYIEIKKMLIGEFYFDINIKREGKDIKVEVKDRHGFDIKINN